MQDSVFEILFLGEDASWSILSHALFDAPALPLHVHRLDSFADLFPALSLGRWQALVVDIHSWNFRGLHYVEKVRRQYPSFPIIALHAQSIPELDSKASTCGASRCIPLEQLTANSLYNAVDSALSDTNSQLILQKGQHMILPLNESEGVTLTFSKNMIITHALNNLLCVISANAEILSDKLNGSAAAANRPLSEIKKAARSAAFLMRHLE